MSNCSKPVYATLAIAHRAYEILRRKYPNLRGAYACAEHDGYHLTSKQPPKWGRWP